MTVGQFCAIHSISRPTVIKYLKLGRLNGFQIGANWEIPQEESDRYLADGFLPDPEQEKQNDES